MNAQVYTFSTDVCIRWEFGLITFEAGNYGKHDFVILECFPHLGLEKKNSVLIAPSGGLLQGIKYLIGNI